MGLGTETAPIPENLVSRKAVMAIAEAEVLIGAVDTAGGDVMNRICSACPTRQNPGAKVVCDHRRTGYHRTSTRQTSA